MFVADSMLDLFLRGTILTTFALMWVIILVRVNGLRSFSKMTNFDFVMTIALGSLLAGAAQSSTWTGFNQSIIAMTILFLLQYTLARLRKGSAEFENLVQNDPILLMQDGIILDAALSKSRVSKSDLIAKLREANVLSFDEVRAVILETTGDLSVLHGEKCDDEMLQGTVRIDK